ncbi:hypothetical protein E4T48_05876 [Aureobasidium sp. EXF-10727]|nr:hypothetical protein E4T48_05876 [Aureobasidium sp. EXF-10727]
MTANHEKQTKPIVSVISGGIAGGVEASVTYPFEFAKTRAQLHVRKQGVPYPRNPFAVVGQVYSQEGLRALYKGCGALVVGSVGKDAVRFLSFDTVKNMFKDPETGTLSPLRNMLAGMAAGVVASATAVTPTERVKTALIDDARGPRQFTSTMHAVRTILAEDGLKGLYRGFAGTTLKQASATSFRMGTYNILKDYEKNHHIEQNTVTNFANGAVAATQPFDVIKTRSQTAKATTTMEAIASIWKDDGVRAFWRGTVMRLGRTVLAGGVLFTTAEAVAKIINPILDR